MQHFITLDPTLGFAVGLALAFLVLLSLEIYNSRRVSRLTYPVYEYAQRRAEEEANRILLEAKAQARKILSEAETAGTSVSGSRKQETEAAESAYEAALKDMLQKLEARISDSAKKAEEAQTHVTSSVLSQLETEGKEARAQLEGSITKLETEHRARMEAELEAAITAARETAATYERVRKEAVDQRIAVLVTETMRIIFQKSLPKDVHADLVRAALEEAKRSGVF